MNALIQTDTHPTRTAPLDLWRVAQAFMHILHALFGGPEQVAARHTLRFEAHKLMASWLRTGEAMMRRLLLIEAAAYSKPNTRPLLHEKRQRVRKLWSFTPDAPEKWRVSFRCFSSPVDGGSASAQSAMTKGARQPKDLSPARPGEPVFVFREGRQARDKSRSLVKRASPRRQTPRPQRKRLPRQDRVWVQRNAPLAFRSAWPLAERYEALLRVYNDPAPYARRLSRRLHATPHRAAALLRAPPEAPHRIDKYDALTQAAEAAHAKIDSS